MCENDVVARVVLATATGRGRAGEAEFEDHVGVYVIRARYLFPMGNDQSAMAISKWLAYSYNLRLSRRFLDVQG